MAEEERKVPPPEALARIVDDMVDAEHAPATSLRHIREGVSPDVIVVDVVDRFQAGELEKILGDEE